MEKKITIYTIAEMANVSISTVSRIINNDFKGNFRIKEKVLEVIKRLNYKPNPHARRFAGKKVESRVIGVMAPFFIDPFFIEVLRGLYRTVHENEYNIVLYDIVSREMKKKVITRIQEENYLDGVLMINMHLNENEYKGITKKMPFVLVAAKQDHVDSISVDHYKGIVLGMQYLYDLGHRNIAFINNEKQIFESRIREKAFRDEAAKLNINYKIDYRTVDRRSGYLAAKTMIENNKEVTCLFYFSDLMAYGGLDFINEKNLRDKVSVIGFDGFEMTLYINLTTIAQPMVKIGERGAEILISKILNKSQQKIVEVVDPWLVKGDTCRRVSYEQ